jgi:hypothetical protein
MMDGTIHHDERSYPVSRTTLDLDPGLLEELKHLAAKRRESMNGVAGRLLREALARELQEDEQTALPLVWHVAERARPAPGFDPRTRDYLDLLGQEP